MRGRRHAVCATAALLLALPCAARARADWDGVAIAPSSVIDGYASEVSVRPGQIIHFHVRTSPPQRYRLDVYRLGAWTGAAPRRLTCVPSCAGSLAGRTWPIPAPDPATGKLNARWPVTATLVVPRRWRSGYYVAKAVVTAGPHAGSGRLVPFVVRAPIGNRSAILVQAPVSTWQAYNRWGGKSLYGYNSTKGVPANHVSFNRPYFDVGVGGQSLFDWEIQLVRFLEREGYDVSYTTDVDVHRDPSELLRHRLVVTAGHDEYWSRERLDGYEAARAAGVNLAFFGANNAYWQVRYEDGARTIVSYRRKDPYPDRTRWTIRFRDLVPQRPECRLMGEMTPDTGALLGGPGLDLPVNPAALAHPWFADTGFVRGSVLRRVVGYEWDRFQSWCEPPGTPTVLFHREGVSPLASADTVTYTAPSGSTVFSAGTFQFSWALDGYGETQTPVDARLRRFVRNMIAALLRPRAPTTGGP
jgi:N,N-dimethylformamidase beta subunit-like, C-terminal